MLWPSRALLACAFFLMSAACGSTPGSANDGGPLESPEPGTTDAGASRDSGEPRDAAAGGDASPSDAARDGPSDAGGSLVTGRHEVLFVGNSYIYANDVAGQYRAIISAQAPDVRVEEVTMGGYTLAHHAADARTDGTPLAHWLRTGPPDETSFDAVVLQEQSQIGGLPAGTAPRVDSVAAASELAALATARGAAVVLYLTWGREHGDPTIIGYGSFTSMQIRLDEGYLDLAAHLRERGANVRLAPVGGAFRIVYEDVLRAGRDPLAEGSQFDALYQSDGSHPSLQGAYLAACVVAGTITGADPTGFVDQPSLGPEVSDRLRDVCARALADPRWHVPTILRADAVLRGDRQMGAIFGSDVAISSGAERLLVGAPGQPGFDGSIRVFAPTPSGWSEEGVWRGSRGLGAAVALSADGTRAIASYPWRELVRDGTSWSEETTLASGPDLFTDLDVSGGRASAIAVGPGDGGPSTVVARVFVREGGSFEEQPLSVEPSSDTFGPAAALDRTGDRAIVGAMGSSVARIFARTEAGWVEEAILTPTFLPRLSPLGRSTVALSADGGRALVGVPAVARAVLFVRSGTEWAEEAILFGPPHLGFGTDVALSADGRRALVGVPLVAPAAGGSGGVRLYELADGSFRWQRLLLPRLPLEGIAPDKLGTSIAMSAAGDRIVAGAPDADTDDGLLYVGRAYTFTVP